MRVLELLMLVLDASGSVGVTEAAATTGLHKATVSRILATLAEREYVTKDPLSGRYVAGPAIVRRLRKPIVEDVLWARGQPILARLRDLSRETASLHVVAWPDRVCIGEVPSLHGLRRAHAPGETWPLTTGATGMAFLAASSEDVVEQALIARPIPESARADFHGKLVMARQTRVAVADAPDHISGMVGMSSPIVGPSGQVIAMVTLSGPAGRLTPGRMQELAPYLAGAADELRAIIGA
jgi:DNA-binding IclR family transcriptional regulator